MTVGVVTDSAGDLPRDVAAGMGIEVVPLTIRFGEDELMDGVDLDVPSFWARCASSSTLPATAAPAIGWFARAYATCAARGATAVVCVTMAAELSGTFQSATLAGAEVAAELPVTVVDSRSVTLGQGLVAIEAATAARAGASLDEVVGAARSAAGRARVWGMLDTFENLRKGGRLGTTRAAIGTMLAIKPLIEVRDGEVVEAGRQRTRRKAVDELIERARAEAPFTRLAVLHALADDVDLVVSAVAAMSETPVLVGDVGAVIGSHTGRGAIGVAGLKA